jgi:hypothetical protein
MKTHNNAAGSYAVGTQGWGESEKNGSQTRAARPEKGRSRSARWAGILIKCVGRDPCTTLCVRLRTAQKLPFSPASCHVLQSLQTLLRSSSVCESRHECESCPPTLESTSLPPEQVELRQVQGKGLWSQTITLHLPQRKLLAYIKQGGPCGGWETGT